MPDSAHERDTLSFDAVIVGAGPAGLAAAVRLGQLAAHDGKELRVAVVEKGAAVGAHIVSGAILDPRALTELIPDWQKRGAPVRTAVREERFLFLSAQRSWRWPHALLPRELRSAGCYVVRLGDLCAWLAEQAESLGVEILPGFAATELLLDETGGVAGVETGDGGLMRDGSKGPAFQPGLEVRAPVTLLGEGCRGSLAGEAIDQFGLDAGRDPQTYGLGLKEVWRVPPGRSRAGRVMHTAGWPLAGNAYGGGFLYELGDDKAAAGLVVGLDYRNPHLDPFAEFQRFKTHPAIRGMLAGGERLSFGARCVTEGGVQSLPRLSFPGGALIGDAAGFLNAARNKGIHAAIYSGMVAADAAFSRLSGDAADLAGYGEAWRRSWLHRELYRARNFRPAMTRGLVAGVVAAGLDLGTLRGRAPWTLRRHATDAERTGPAAGAVPPTYTEPDGVVSFDRASSVYLSGVRHREDQPNHLKLGDPELPARVHAPRFALPEPRICPAGALEPGAGAGLRMQPSNCLHCKACEIKDPSGNIRWTPPEGGGGGPGYSGM